MKRLANIIGAVCLVLALDAMAADPEIVEEVVVIKVSPDASPEEVYSEIRKQARRACRTRAYQAHTHISHVAECKRQFVADAVQAFERPELAVLHQTQTGEQATQLADSGSQ